MGCHSSKQAQHDLLHSPSPLRRSNSLPPNDHVVSLTSSTLGSLDVDTKQSTVPEDSRHVAKDLSAEIANARAWSSGIGCRIPRTPTETPPCEPESIDAWELMAGLHGDSSPLDRRSFSFYPVGDDVQMVDDGKKRNANVVGKEKAKAKAAVIFYFTSLRGVRKTYDDCCSVRAMLREHGVHVDERDVSMHAGFKEELKEASGGVGVPLPRVLVGGRDIGGEAEVRRMHEGGELGRLLEGCKGDGGDEEDECEGCGDIRFVPCGRCSGSCRVYVDETEEGETEEEDGCDRGWRRCLECNENGIVRCPVCCC